MIKPTAPLMDETSRNAEWMRAKRAAERDLVIPKAKDPERRKRCESDVFEFLSTYFPGAFSQPFTDDRRELVEKISSAGATGANQAIAAPRGEGKTTITEKCVIYLVLTGRVQFVVLFAATGAKAADLLDNIKLEFIENEILAEDYPEVSFPVEDLNGAPQRANAQTYHGGKPLRMKWGVDYVRLPQVDGFAGAGVRIKTHGLDSAVRGIKKGDVRPDLVIIDDPETEESADSPRQIYKRRMTIERAIKGMRAPGKRLSVVMLTTIQNRHCLSYEYTDPASASSWAGKRQRFFKSWPVEEQLWQDYIEQRKADQKNGDPFARKAHRFYLKNRKRMDAGADVSNPYRFEADELPDGTQKEVSAVQHAYNLIADGDTGGGDGKAYFLTEYQNDPPEEDEPITGTITERIVRERANGLARGLVPAGGKYLVAMVDVGKWRLHYAVTAWSKDGSMGWVIDYGERSTNHAGTEGAESAISGALTELATDWDETPYLNEEGEPVRMSHALVDSGNWNNVVYDFTKSRGKPWQPSMGDSRFRMPKAKSKEKRPGHGGPWYESKQRPRVWVVNFDPDYWKHRVHELFQVEGEGLQLFGQSPSEHIEFAQHVTAEIWTEETLEKPTGKVVRRYFRTVRHDNHYFDCVVGCCVAGAMAGAFGNGSSSTRKVAARTGSKSKRRRQSADSDDSGGPVFRMVGPSERPRTRPGRKGKR